MARSISDIEKKRSRGRPATDSTPVLVRLSPAIIEAIDALREEFAKAYPDRVFTRPLIIRSLATSSLKEWGWITDTEDRGPTLLRRTTSKGAPKPAGPATDAVEAMDAAIQKDRVKSGRRKR